MLFAVRRFSEDIFKQKTPLEEMSFNYNVISMKWNVRVIRKCLVFLRGV